MTPTVEAALDARLHPFSDGIRVELDAHSEHLRELRSDFEGYRNAVDSRLDSLATDIAVLTRYLPKIMNTVASQNAVHRDQQRKIHSLQSVVDGLPGRIEFIRKEMLLEQRYQADAPVTLPAPEPKIINEEKLHEMGDNLRINLGAGHVPLADYLNVDIRAVPGIDVVADVTDLPFAAGELAEIYSAHLLEHFPAEELRRKVLPYWVSLLRDGGKLVAVVPDIETMVKERAAGRLSFDDFREVTYGGQEYAGDFHFNAFSPESITEALEEAGLSDVVIRETGRRDGLCYEMEVEATRSTASND